MKPHEITGIFPTMDHATITEEEIEQQFIYGPKKWIPFLMENIKRQTDKAVLLYDDSPGMEFSYWVPKSECEAVVIQGKTRTRAGIVFPFKFYREAFFRRFGWDIK